MHILLNMCSVYTDHIVFIKKGINTCDSITFFFWSNVSRTLCCCEFLYKILFIFAFKLLLLLFFVLFSLTVKWIEKGISFEMRTFIAFGLKSLYVQAHLYNFLLVTVEIIKSNWIGRIHIVIVHRYLFSMMTSTFAITTIIVIINWFNSIHRLIRSTKWSFNIFFSTAFTLSHRHQQQQQQQFEIFYILMAFGMSCEKCDSFPFNSKFYNIEQ